MRLSITAATLLVSIALCASAQADDPGNFANPVKFIAQAVDGEINYGSAGSDLTGLALIEHATRNDPKPVAAIRSSGRYTLDAHRDGMRSAVLLCDGDMALYEDAGCTGPVDRNVVGKGEPCGFALDLKQTCEKRR